MNQSINPLHFLHAPLKNFFILIIGVVFPIIATAASNTLILKGPMMEGGMIQGKAPLNTIIRVEGHTLSLTPQGHFVFGFHRDSPKEIPMEITYPDGSKEKKILHVAQRKYNFRRINGVPPQKVTPSKKFIARIKKEIKLVKLAKYVDTPMTNFEQKFHCPIRAKYIISGHYGDQRIFNGKKKFPHYGLDLAVPTGTPIYAPTDGIVALAQHNLYFSGGTVILNHGHGIMSSFLHMSTVRVKKGQHLKQGTIIGNVGSTGRATGPHLDWRISWFDKRLDVGLLSCKVAPPTLKDAT